MKNRLTSPLIIGYLVLLVINVIEFRSGIWLSVLQLIFGLSVFLPQIVTGLHVAIPNLVDAVLKIGYLLTLGGGIWYKWYDAPNHMFLFFYLTLLLLFTKNESDLKDNLRWSVVIIMGFATLHKLMNPNFISGEFMAYRLLSGDFFQPIYMSGLFPQIKGVLDENYQSIYEFTRSESFLTEQISLKNVRPNLMAGLKFFVYSIIGMEFLVAALFAFFYKRLAFIVLLIFVASIGLIVSEFEFAATLLLMGAVMCPSTYSSLRSMFWVAFILYAFLAVRNNIMLW